MVELILVGVLLVVAYVGGYRHGKGEGGRLERGRCHRILIRSLYVRHSPTTQEILACVAGEQTEAEMETNLENINKAVDRMNKKEKTDGE